MNAFKIHQAISHPDTLTERALEAKDELDLAAFAGKPHAAAFTGSDGKEATSPSRGRKRRRSIPRAAFWKRVRGSICSGTRPPAPSTRT